MKLVKNEMPNIKIEFVIQLLSLGINEIKNEIHDVFVSNIRW